MKIGVPKEIHAGERRVATTPEAAEWLHKLGHKVYVQAGAGVAASYSDDAYRESGVEVVEDARRIWQESDIVLKVRPPEADVTAGVHELDRLREGGTLVSFLYPAQNKELLDRLVARRATAVAMDCVPRLSRAQKLDALSSMANIAGYRAVIEAAHHFGRFFTGQVTAAGKVPPAKVMIIGAGVAGLAAIGAARSLGAIVRAFDTRPEVKEQVQSLDAEFLELDFAHEGGGTAGGYARQMSEEFIKAEMDLFMRQAMEVDIIITTALIPGKPAPRLITESMVECMRDGGVIVDLAAEQGGNCALTEPGKVVLKRGVTIVGYTDLPSRLPTQSSQLYATNLRHLLTDLTPAKDGKLVVDMDDVVIRGATVVREGVITWPPPEITVSAGPAAAPKPAPVTVAAPEEPERTPAWNVALGMLAAAAAFFGIGAVAPAEFMHHFTVFVLACFVGYMVIWNVTPALHTPLMSVTNAISGIIVIGAVLQVSSDSTLVKWLAGIGVLIASINIAGGFLVTQRMLQMFRR
ncbi:MAG: Re/Si-specific NAD(P)(+) transhydrogenase subunit alpha [Gammaproteobacteria bacterium]|nr:Re/Si-specific NAD(P)(+) transhydrogenase subunit alpha [Gammaproteobacteria bacterium]